MEPTPRTLIPSQPIKEQIVYYTTIESLHTSITPGMWGIKMTDIQSILFLTEPHGFTKGDRVKITITKEPADAHSR